MLPTSIPTVENKLVAPDLGPNRTRRIRPRARVSLEQGQGQEPLMLCVLKPSTAASKPSKATQAVASFWAWFSVHCINETLLCTIKKRRSGLDNVHPASAAVHY